jgi:oligopeptide transport system ATP-binding protein
MNPKLIIADECISALDVSIQAQVVNLMKDIQQTTGCAYLFIAHDLSMVKYISDRIGVLHLGHMVETGSREEILFPAGAPLHAEPPLRHPAPEPGGGKKPGGHGLRLRAYGVDYLKGADHLWRAPTTCWPPTRNCEVDGRNGALTHARP